MIKYLSPRRYVYALFERTRFGRFSLFPLAAYQRISLIISRIAFRNEIKKNRIKFQDRKILDKEKDDIIQNGYCILDIKKMPFGQQLLDICQEILQSRSNQNTSVLNPYSIADKNELLKLPDINNFLNSKELIEIAANYLGTEPILTAVNLLESRPRQGPPKGAQNCHLDNISPRVVRLVIHISDVNEDNGPFTFYNLTQSQTIEDTLNYRWRFDYAEISEPELTSATASINPQKVVGDKGTMILVDTCRCLHFGSRVQTGLRHVLMATYSTPPFTSVRWMMGLH